MINNQFSAYCKSYDNEMNVYFFSYIGLHQNDFVGERTNSWAPLHQGLFRWPAQAVRWCGPHPQCPCEHATCGAPNPDHHQSRDQSSDSWEKRRDHPSNFKKPEKNASVWNKSTRSEIVNHDSNLICIINFCDNKLKTSGFANIVDGIKLKKITYLFISK